MLLFSKSTLLLPLLASISTATALNCTEGQALLEVKYNMTEDTWNSTYPTADTENEPFLYLPGSAQFSLHNYHSFADLVDFEQCLPRNECSEVVVASLPTNSYQIRFDGNSLDIGVEIPFNGKNPVTSTEVGTCTKPTCKDSEALVDLQYWNGDLVFIGSTYRIEDRNGNYIINATSTSFDSLTRNRACVPRDNACGYTFLIGNLIQWDPTLYVDTPSYNLFYDGKLVSKGDSWLFGSIQFGDSCQPRCNQDNESMVELFLYDDGSSSGAEYDYEYGWDLTLVTDGASVPSSSGVVPIGPSKSPLYHETICTPKASCSSFVISAPENAPIMGMSYALAMDNNTYRMKQWYPINKSLNETTNMGSCTLRGLCDEHSQDLFELELHTPERNTEDIVNGRSSPVIRSDASDGISWVFDYSDVVKREQLPILTESQYIGEAYELDSSYRTVECVPKSECDLAFNITADLHGASYIVRKNGVKLDDSRELPDEVFTSRMWIMTPFGQNCFPVERRLSSGAIAGIIIACLVLLSVTIGVIMGCLNRHKERQNKRDEEDPLSESLL
mmetsp:Transcript_28118/g.41956  ORF Transcript_28118/g.41956 Transcript_28118/m.41956 type:complete len:559 (-) Transcript_28118:2010-3686(-)